MTKIDTKALDNIVDKLIAYKRPVGNIPENLNLPQQPLLIEHQIDDVIIAQRPSDGYINATAMCKKLGKLFADYHRLLSTTEFIEELAKDMGIPISSLIQIIKTPIHPHMQGTWVHPDVAINLAQWLSPKFSVQVSRWVREWMSGEIISGKMPQHLRRYVANMGKIRNGYFSMLNESMYSLFAPLEQLGYVMPDRLMPDISYGRMFSDFLRSKGIRPEEFPEYSHEFTDSKRPPVNARLYPNKYLGDFRDYLTHTWIPNKSIPYFSKADKKAIPYLSQIIVISVQKD